MLCWQEGLLHNGDLIVLECGYFTTHVHSARTILVPSDYLSHCPRLHVAPYQGGDRDTKLCAAWFICGKSEVSLANGAYMTCEKFALKLSDHLHSLLY